MAKVLNADLKAALEKVSERSDPNEIEALSKLVEIHAALDEMDRANRLPPWLQLVVGPILGAAVGFLVFFGQQAITRPVESARFDAVQYQQAREWRLSFVNFVAEQRSLLFGPYSADKQAIVELIGDFFPGDVSGGFLLAMANSARADGDLASQTAFQGAAVKSRLAEFAGPLSEGPFEIVVRHRSEDEPAQAVAESLVGLLLSSNLLIQARVEARTPAQAFPAQSEVRYYDAVDLTAATELAALVTDALRRPVLVNPRAGDPGVEEVSGRLVVYLRSDAP